MAKTLTLRLDDETYRTFQGRAEAESRSIANYIEAAVKAHIQDQDFTDDYEIAEILADEALVKRLKRGSRDAKQRKGKLVG